MSDDVNGSDILLSSGFVCSFSGYVKTIYDNGKGIDIVSICSNTLRTPWFRVILSRAGRYLVQSDDYSEDTPITLRHLRNMLITASYMV
jgi:hypothetical protein